MLKIDQRVIRDALTHDAAIVQVIIDMTGALKLQFVAKNVALLRLMSCRRTPGTTCPADSIHDDNCR